MHGRKRLNRFDLNNHLVCNDQIDPKSQLQFHAFVMNRKTNLLNDSQALLPQFETKRGLVYRLQQSRTQSSVNLECSIENCSSYFIFGHVRISFVSLRRRKYTSL